MSDDREFARLFKLAADQGDAFAQVQLVFFYEHGRGGLPKNDREAARLYKLAAYHGYAAAQSNLGAFYAGWRRTIARPRGSSSSPRTRETPWRNGVSGCSTS